VGGTPGRGEKAPKKGKRRGDQTIDEKVGCVMFWFPKGTGAVGNVFGGKGEGLQGGKKKGGEREKGTEKGKDVSKKGEPRIKA